jgi:pimeloyl-ACP methyl ester carboxylesterase
MGGFVALRLATRHPDLVAAVVVSGSSADVEEQPAAYDSLLEKMAQGGVEPVLDALTQRLLGDRTIAERPELTAQVRERLAGLGPEIADPAWQVAHRAPVLDELDRVRVPVLILAGADDRADPPAESREMAGAHPDGQPRGPRRRRAHRVPRGPRPCDQAPAQPPHRPRVGRAPERSR